MSTTTPPMATTGHPDRIIYRSELGTLLNGACSETIRRYIKAGKIPKPDVAITRKTTGWKLSTLQAAGVGVV